MTDPSESQSPGLDAHPDGYADGQIASPAISPAMAEPPPPVAADILSPPPAVGTVPNQPGAFPSAEVFSPTGGSPELALGGPREPTRLKPVWLIAVAVAAIMADVALRRVPWNNVAGSLLIVALAGGLLASGFVRSTSGRLLITGAGFFGVFVALRTEPLLIMFNVLAAISLLILGAIHGQRRPFWDFRPMRMFGDAGVLLLEGVSGMFEVPAELAARYRVAKEQSTGESSKPAYAVLRGLAIAVPIVLVFGLLLASADAVFESFFTSLDIFDPAVLVGHAMLMVIGAYTMMVLLRMAATEGATDPIAKAPGLGHIEAGVVLGSVNLLFGAFAVAQLMTVLGGAEEALARANLDSKHFARQGFFQLLWVAGLTLGLLMVLHVATSENIKARRIIRWLSLLTVGLTVLIVAVALTRISFYINDGGQTPLRLYAAVFSTWVAVAFVITAVRIMGVKPNQAWLMPALFVSGLMTLAILNVANPERMIALDNLNRDHDGLIWHVRDGKFTGDGQAVLAAEIDRLSPERADLVTTRLCADYAGYDYQSGILNFNLGKWRAERELTKLCP
ncbi:MAG: DUF4153 domain-containing protein [Acidimicrobiales bacterium]